MAHVWKLDIDANWVAAALPDVEYQLAEVGAHAVLLRRIVDTPNTWALVTGEPANVRLNGFPLAAGIAVLADRDEIRTGGRTVWFSTETRPSVEPLSTSAARGACPRCKRPLESGQLAVRCPNCGVSHHEDGSDWNCWSYAPTCAVCHTQLTALDAPFRWSPPEDL